MQQGYSFLSQNPDTESISGSNEMLEGECRSKVQHFKKMQQKKQKRKEEVEAEDGPTANKNT